MATSKREALFDALFDALWEADRGGLELLRTRAAEWRTAYPQSFNRLPPMAQQFFTVINEVCDAHGIGHEPVPQPEFVADDGVGGYEVRYGGQLVGRVVKTFGGAPWEGNTGRWQPVALTGERMMFRRTRKEAAEALRAAAKKG